MSGPSTYEPKTGFTKWMDERLPIIRFGADLMDFPTPKNLNYWWTFGGILAVMLVVQIVTGIVLAMHYVANTSLAFELGRAYPPRRGFRLADPGHPRQRRVDVLPRRVHPHVPRPVLRLIQIAA